MNKDYWNFMQNPFLKMGIPKKPNDTPFLKLAFVVRQSQKKWLISAPEALSVGEHTKHPCAGTSWWRKCVCTTSWWSDVDPIPTCNQSSLVYWCVQRLYAVCKWASTFPNALVFVEIVEGCLCYRYGRFFRISQLNRDFCSGLSFASSSSDISICGVSGNDRSRSVSFSFR